MVWFNTALLAVAALTAARAPRLRLPIVVRMMVAVSLVVGGRAMHESFAVIRWEAAGIGPGAAGLWSE